MGLFGKSNEDRIKELETRIEEIEEKDKGPIDYISDVVGKTLTAPLSGIDEVFEKLTPKK